jgi:hypothetical protein
MLAACDPRGRRGRRGRRRMAGTGPAASSAGMGDAAGPCDVADRGPRSSFAAEGLAAAGERCWARSRERCTSCRGGAGIRRVGFGFGCVDIFQGFAKLLQDVGPDTVASPLQ